MTDARIRGLETPLSTRGHIRDIRDICRATTRIDRADRRGEVYGEVSSVATILIVDDSQVERQLAGGLLKKHFNVALRFAENGKEALDQMRRAAPDLVLTDLVMPEMDGLELVRMCRARYPQVPVVLMTAYGNELIAVEALREGAASYVPKAGQAERLVETVKQVLTRAATERGHRQLLNCRSHFRAVFEMENDPELIRALVDLVQETLADAGHGDVAGRIRIGLALEEALRNALYHGNLQIGAGDWSQAKAALDERQFAEFIARRGALPHYLNRKTRVEVDISADQARFVIHDGGNGFHRDGNSRTKVRDSFEQGTGRGLTLIESLMDEVKYNAAGNEVTMLKHRDVPSEAPLVERVWKN